MNVKLEQVSRFPEKEQHEIPLLFIHGCYHAAWCWEVHFLDYFAQRGYVAHAVSLRGHGGSKVGAHSWYVSVSKHVADVEKVIDRLPTTPVIIGHSLGNRIVQRYLESHDAPGAIMLAALPPVGIHLGKTLRYLVKYPLVTMRSWFKYWSTDPRALQSIREGFYSSQLSDEALRGYAARLEKEALLTLLGMMLHQSRRYSTTTPILVLGASNDGLLFPEYARKTSKAYGTEAVMFEIGHDMMLDAGWRKVADYMGDWLDENVL